MIALNQGPSSEAVQKALENHASQASRGAIVVASATNVIIGNDDSDSANKNSSSQPQQPGNQPGGDGNDQDGQPRMTAAEARHIFAKNFKTLSINAPLYGASLDTYQRLMTMMIPAVHVRDATHGTEDRFTGVDDVRTTEKVACFDCNKSAWGPLLPDVVMEVGDPTRENLLLLDQRRGAGRRLHPAVCSSL